MRIALLNRKLTLAAALAGLALAGCGSSGSGMMGAAGHSTGTGRMGVGGSYHFARLTCSPPRSLPGHIINVTLGDLGMTQMMGGTAPRAHT